MALDGRMTRETPLPRRAAVLHPVKLPERGQSHLPVAIPEIGGSAGPEILFDQVFIEARRPARPFGHPDLKRHWHAHADEGEKGDKSKSEAAAIHDPGPELSPKAVQERRQR